jgi:enoyl-CoA hydratase
MDSTPRMRLDRPEDGVLALWLDRPEKRNALDDRMVSELLEALHPEGARAIVLGSSDSRCFCAGADVGLQDEERARLSDRLYELYERMVRLPAPIVVALEGPAVGGGAQLAIAADLRVAAPSASLRFVGPGHGLAVGAWALTGLVGRGRAADLCLSMRSVDAREALEAGLVDRIDADPKRAAVELATSIAQLDLGATQRVKSIIHQASSTLVALAEERRGNRASWSGALAAVGGPGASSG